MIGAKNDGMNYAPVGKTEPVVQQGEFVFSVIGLNHGHIYGMCNGLLEAGATLKSVYDPDPRLVEAFQERHPTVQIAKAEEDILQDGEVKLIAGAKITSERAALGMRVMDHGKDYFTDKAPFTTLTQLEEARAKAKATGQKYMVYYSERLHVESAIHAGHLIEDGAIGRVIQVIGTGPHRLNAQSRPDWFFNHSQYGGILCDIGSHQVEQFLHFSGARGGKVLHSKVGNYANPDYPELEDFGDATIVADNGATNYFRVDWFTPDGLSTWGDGRTFILGEKGTIELRKYIDIARSANGDQLFLANHEGEFHMDLKGKVGFPFFGQLILDVLNRTERAMTQEHAFLAAELSLKAQEQAIHIQKEAQSLINS
ncbi:Gfo/Idh/MocA family oxidoreductase [Bacillaceae bacterium SIJ1]|uniref:Gfo/Idh/MocA family protein n=1 Tax=Litoribacterium kuwaitense TaxID=1398745 RepID=UPI0013EDCE00|nr:Gfo/Idh/MocA family oxidoreductase [Litoribacterium kuwaitense]NGP44476.1 Gfo/Idh/MocA family oxidoreductase [Litoribacterium kuwaitense]